LAIRNDEKVWAAIINSLSAPKYNKVAKFTQRQRMNTRTDARTGSAEGGGESQSHDAFGQLVFFLAGNHMTTHCF